MTTDSEKRFFNTFGIEKIIPCYKCNMQNTNWDCKRICLYDDEKRKEYPQITDRILLEIEDIIHSEYNILIYEKLMYSIRITAHLMDDNLGCDSSYYRVQAEAETKKEALLVLAMDINVKDTIKYQVQALFKEER